MRICVDRDSGRTTDLRHRFRVRLQFAAGYWASNSCSNGSKFLAAGTQILLRDDHKRLYSTLAFYSYVWSIVKRRSAEGESKRARLRSNFGGIRGMPTPLSELT